MKRESQSIKNLGLQSSLLQTKEERNNSFQSFPSNNIIELQHYKDDDLYQQKSSNLNPRLLFRAWKPNNRQQNYHQQTPLNITFLYLQYLKENNSIGRKILFANVILDIFIRLSIFYFFCSGEHSNSNITTLFIAIIQVPRLFHMFTTLKLLFMDQYKLQNRSFIPISHLYRQNFICEEETKESDIKPLRYKNQILSWQSFLFVITPVELCFLSVPKKNSYHIINTIIISCYILKSIEIVLFEPALLIIVILNFPKERITQLNTSVQIFIWQYLVKQAKEILQKFDLIKDENDFYIK